LVIKRLANLDLNLKEILTFVPILW